MNNFEILTINNHVVIDDESVFNRQEYTIYNNNSELYSVYNGSSNAINHEVYKNYFYYYLINNFIIVNNNNTKSKFALYITKKPLENEYITVNNKLNYIRPYIYQSGMCSYDDHEYFYFITDIIEEYTKDVGNNSIITLFYLFPCFKEFNTINYVCPDIKRHNIVSGKFSNADEPSIFIFMNEFTKENNTINKNIFNSIYTEITKNVTINDNLISTLLIQMNNIGLYNCVCKHVKFFDEYSIFDIDGKFYFRDEAVNMFVPNKGFITPYDFLAHYYVDKYKILDRTFEYPFNSQTLSRVIFDNLNYFDDYYTFNLRATRLGLNIPKNIFDYLINHMYMFEETYEDFQEINKPRFIIRTINENVYNIIKENELLDSYYNFTSVAPQDLKDMITQYDYYYIMKILSRYDYKIVDFISNEKDVSNYDFETQEKINDYSYLNCIGFKNTFIKTIFCIMEKISNGEFINSEYIIENFDTLITNFNNYLGRLGDLYFSTLAIGIIYLTYTRIENTDPDFTFMNDILEKLLSYIAAGIVSNTKIANEMIKSWCLKGKMLPLANCDKAYLTKKLYGKNAKHVNLNYQQIDFDHYVNPDYNSTGRKKYRHAN